MKYSLIILPIAILFSQNTANANLPYLYQYGSDYTGLANSGAGSESFGADINIINPAGMTNLKASTFHIGASQMSGEVKFNLKTSSYSGTEGGNALITNRALYLYFVRKLNSKSFIGISRSSQQGIQLDFGDNFAARGYVQNTDLKFQYTSFSYAKKLNRKFSIGLGLHYIQGQISSQSTQTVLAQDAIVRINGNDQTVAYFLGLRFKYNQKINISMVYRSQEKHKFKKALIGEGYYQGKVYDINIDLPESFEVGASYKIENNTLLSSVEWKKWSRTQESKFTIKASGEKSVFNRKLDDMIKLKLGNRYQINNVNLDLGVGWFSEPYTEKSGRTPDLPIDESFLLAVGAGLKFKDESKLNFGVNYWKLGKSSTALSNSDLGALDGNYSKNYIMIYSLSFSRQI